MTLELWVIRVLRWAPKTYRFDRHLTDCAALAVFFAPWNGCEKLRISHIFRLRPLPDFRGPEAERRHAAMLKRSEFRTLQ